MSQKARIDTYHVQMLAYLLEKMQATPDGDGSLLDHSLILYGSGMGNGNLHRHSDLPVLLAGKLDGKFKTGYHLDHPMNTPMANLLVTTETRTVDRRIIREILDERKSWYFHPTPVVATGDSCLWRSGAG
jgi:hypothetical protein